MSDYSFLPSTRGFAYHLRGLREVDIRFNNGSGLFPDVAVDSAKQAQGSDAAYQKALELLMHR
jgi:hypothetical protein